MSRKKKTTADTKAKSEKKYYDYNEKDGMWVYYGRNEIAFWGAIVLSVIIMGIAAGIHYICYGSFALYKDAPYHLETDATVIMLRSSKKKRKSMTRIIRMPIRRKERSIKRPKATPYM